MSDEGHAFVKRYSPYTGNTWWFHYVMGDLANRQYDYLIFISDRKLAEEWPLTRSTCTRSRGLLLVDGFLTPVDDRGGPGKPRIYRFEFRDHEEMRLDNPRHHEAGSKSPASWWTNPRQGDAGTRVKRRAWQARN